MFKINMVLSDIVMYFPINTSGVEDSVETLQSYLDVCCAVMVFESYEIHYFSFCHSNLDRSPDFNSQICFHSHFFTVHTSLAFWVSNHNLITFQKDIINMYLRPTN